MPLSTAKKQLEQDLLTAFDEVTQMAIDAGKNNDSDNIKKQLAANLAAAIHDYTTSAQVNITSIVSTVPPGVPVATAGTPNAQAGLTVGPGIAQHAGFGSLQ